MLNIIFPIFDILFLVIDNESPMSIMYADIFSRFNPIINEVIVVAILLPSIIPMLLLNVSIFAFISPIVSIITAELDCISDVVTNPNAILFGVEDVKFNSFCFILFKDIFTRLLLKESIE